MRRNNGAKYQIIFSRAQNLKSLAISQMPFIIPIHRVELRVFVFFFFLFF